MKNDAVITIKVADTLDKITEKLDLMSKQSTEHIAESKNASREAMAKIVDISAILAKHDEKIESHDISIREAQTTMKVLRKVIYGLGVVISLISGYVGWSVDAFLKEKTQDIIQQQVEEQLKQYNTIYEDTN